MQKVKKTKLLHTVPMEPSSETEMFMMTNFRYDWDNNDTQHELEDILAETTSKLCEEDRLILYEIFYEGKTYEELSGILGIKAKSHAWSKTRRAMDRLRELLSENPRFMEITNGYH